MPYSTDPGPLRINRIIMEFKFEDDGTRKSKVKMN